MLPFLALLYPRIAIKRQHNNVVISVRSAAGIRTRNDYRLEQATAATPVSALSSQTRVRELFRVAHKTNRHETGERPDYIGKACSELAEERG